VIRSGGPRHDLARFGMEKTGVTPRQADLMIVAGRVSQKPVDIYLPGCPPRPEMLMDAILKLTVSLPRAFRRPGPPDSPP
jgi:NADH-quinone oxidoreductase subunit B